tara:strand:+ start:554 stop:727 length:174 start_codon:yes stop_codon:yes gene_type:complete
VAGRSEEGGIAARLDAVDHGEVAEERARHRDERVGDRRELDEKVAELRGAASGVGCR